MRGDLPCSQKSHDLARGFVPELRASNGSGPSTTARSRTCHIVVASFQGILAPRCIATALNTPAIDVEFLENVAGENSSRASSTIAATGGLCRSPEFATRWVSSPEKSVEGAESLTPLGITP
jgi:hypothetical protein